MKLQSQRREYRSSGLRRADLAADPLAQFEQWMRQALDAGVPDPTAMAAATVSTAGQPSQRIVLLKHFDARGFVFYTHYDSLKARELAGNPHISLLLFWNALNRQVKILGTAERIGAQDSADYFASRPRPSQLAALASRQSRPLESREELLAAYRELEARFGDGQIPPPADWGGIRVRASEYEFWQGRPDRLHDRFRYSRAAEGEWEIARLAP